MWSKQGASHLPSAQFENLRNFEIMKMRANLNQDCALKPRNLEIEPGMCELMGTVRLALRSLFLAGT